jgi:hypothetical protein
VLRKICPHCCEDIGDGEASDSRITDLDVPPFERP